MSKRNLRQAASLATAIAVLDEWPWTWLARRTLKMIAKRLIAKGIS
jgi:hypothetical protein